MIKESITIRQLICMYLFISISPIARQLPNQVTKIAGTSSYFSSIISFIVMLPLVGVVLVLLYKFNRMNIYEIMIQICGKILAKLIITCYFLWALLSAVIKMNAYTLMLQTTLMPSMKTRHLIIVMLLLVTYAFSKGTKTVLRFAEFVVIPVIGFLLFLFVFTVSKIEVENLLPISMLNMKDNMVASVHAFTIGGNIILILFFANQIREDITYRAMIRKIVMGISIFVVMSIVCCVVTIGLNGASLTSKLSYPVFSTVKNVSVLTTFGRLESFITLVCIFSDFIAICIYVIIMIQCLSWIFGENKLSYYKAVLVIAAGFVIIFLDQTQFELEYIYSSILVYSNVVAQYIFPFTLFILYICKRGIRLLIAQKESF